jgi:hypothetical protein
MYVSRLTFHSIPGKTGRVPASYGEFLSLKTGWSIIVFPEQKGDAMIDCVLFYGLLLVALCWLYVIGLGTWPHRPVALGQPQGKPVKPITKHSKDPQLFPGLTRKPSCEACEQGAAPRAQAPSALPPRLAATRGRPRAVDTSTHFCPNSACAYTGWVGRGNIRANGRPGGAFALRHC